jgi:hypothetical protein
LPLLQDKAMRFMRWKLLQHMPVGLALFAAVARAQAPADAPPDAEQLRVLRAVAEFAQGYLDRLPNFTCVRTTEHYVASPVTRRWRAEAKTAYELSYYERDEHYKLISVDGVLMKKVPARSKYDGWLEMSGNFGWILKQLFDPGVHPHFTWHGWDSAQGRRAMVFSYRISLAESHAVSTTCGAWLIFSTCRDKTYAFHGLLYIDAASLDILRIEDVPEGLPANYFQGNTSVDYGRVTVAGSEYLLPVADRIETTAGKTLFRNDSVYSDYRKFVAESTLKPDTESEVP